MRRFAAGKQLQPTRGFRGWYGYSEEGEMLEAGGERYIMSTMLSVPQDKDLSGLGMPLASITNNLLRSVKADNTVPTGTFYFSRYADIRSQTRSAYFEMTTRELEKLGQKTEIGAAVYPQQKKDIMGAVLGFATHDVVADQTPLIPGAIVENLTSYGGRFDKGAPTNAAHRVLEMRCGWHERHGR